MFSFLPGSNPFLSLPLFDVAHVHFSQFSCMESLTWMWGGGTMLTVQLGFLRDWNTVLESSIISGSLHENNIYNSPTVVHENIYTAVLFSHLVY